LEIKERLDKWNGTIPHLSEDLKEIKEDYKKMGETLGTHIVEETKNISKIKIMWGILGAVGTALVGATVKLLLNM